MAKVREGDRAKTCTMCHVEYPATLEHFYAHKTASSGLTWWCRSCFKEKKLEWANSERGQVCNRACSQRYYCSEKGLLNARVKAHRRRAVGPLPRDIYALLFEAQDGLCFYCECDLKESGYDLEHLTPISRGGDNSILENLRLACPFCNGSKNNKPWQQYMLEKGMVTRETLSTVYGWEG